MTIHEQARQARAASRELALLSADQKNRLLLTVRDGLLASREAILSANAQDVSQGKANGLGPFLDRIILSESRLKAIAESLETLIGLPDPVGTVIDERTRPNGLRIARVRVPLGVIGMIYEARPNVTVDAAALALKSGNAVILKGGSAALHSNRALTSVIKGALQQNGLSPDAVGFIDSGDRAAVFELLTCARDIDCIIPRGGRELIDFVREHSKIPVIETGASVVHMYIDRSADLHKAVQLAVNAKTRRVSICNALDTLLVHRAISDAFLPLLAAGLTRQSEASGDPLTEVRADPSLQALMKGYANLQPVSEADFDTEFLDHVMAIKQVDSAEAAIRHITDHSLRHSEAIVTEDQATADHFLRAVDAACVYHNASTQFSDGGEFGLGAEIGISTQKLHARGPFALEGLTTYKWVIRGEGQVRS